MVDLSPAKVLVVLVVALVVLGPDKLPRMARQAGRLVNDFRRFRDSVNDEVREAFGDPSGLSDLQHLSSLSNLPAQGRAWVSSLATSSLSQTSPPPGAAPSGNGPSGARGATAPSPPGVSSAGPPSVAGVGHPPHRASPEAASPEAASPEAASPDGASPGSDGGFEARFN